MRTETEQQKPPFWRHLFSWLIYLKLWTWAQLPYRLLLGIGILLGVTFKHLSKSRRRVIQKNIASCFPKLDKSQQTELINQNYRETGMMVSHTLKVFLSWNDDLFKELNIEGAEHLKQAQANGQGVLLVSGHFTALDVGGRVICQQFPVSGVYRPHKNPVQEYVVKESREKYAKQMFTRDELKGIIKELKAGGTVWYAPDQDYRRGQSIFSDFFGTKASTITATHQLARISGCQVMFYSVKRIKEKPYYQLAISPPLTDFPSKDVQKDTDRINQGIEQMVNEAPEQYLWLHKRFKTRPEGEANFY